MYLTEITKNPILKDNISKIIVELQKAPLGNATAGVLAESGRSFPLSVEESKYWDGTIKSDEDWKGMVEFWYTIRNNLFHGTKVPSRKRDLFMVKYGYNSLKELVKILHCNKSSIINQ